MVRRALSVSPRVRVEGGCWVAFRHLEISTLYYLSLQINGSLARLLSRKVSMLLTNGGVGSKLPRHLSDPP